MPSRLSRVLLAFAPPCPHLETASAVFDDGSSLTNATLVAPARPPSSTRIGPQPRGTKTPGTAWAAPVDATPGDLLRANASHPVEPRLSLPAQDLCNSKALPPIQEVLARMIGVRAAVTIAAHAFQPARLASYGAGVPPGAHLL